MGFSNQTDMFQRLDSERFLADTMILREGKGLGKSLSRPSSTD
jgi:hypothetical protein